LHHQCGIYVVELQAVLGWVLPCIGRQVCAAGEGMVFEGIALIIPSSYNSSESMPSYKRNKLPLKTELYSRVLGKQFNPFAPGDFAENPF